MDIKKYLFAACLSSVFLFTNAQKLYIAENGAQRIQRTNGDGSNLQPLSTAGQVGAIKDIVIDEERNRVFWVEQDATSTYVKRADLTPNAGVIELTNVSDHVRVAVANQFEALAIHKGNRELYITTTGSGGEIYRVDLDDQFTTTVLPTPTIGSLFASYGIDVDEVNDKMYFVNTSTTRQIQIANSDGTSPSVILNISGTLGTPHDVAVDPAGGFLYFSTNNGGVGQIYRATLSGGSPTLLINSLPNTIKGISLDTQNGFIYWATGGATVGRANIDGTGATNIVTGLSTANYIGFDFDSTIPPKLYWTEGGLQEIHRINTDGSDFERYYFGGFSPYPTGIAIDPNARTIFWTDGQHNNIKRGLIGETDFDNPEVILDYPDASPGMQGLEIDPDNTMIYFADVDNGRIQRADYSNTPPLTGSDIVSIANPFGIDLDLINGKIYYTANDNAAINTGTLYRANLDGTGQEPLWSDTEPDPQRFIHDVKVDPVNGIVYWVWTEPDGIATIYKADITDVSGTVSPLVNPTGGEVRGIEIDIQSNKIWWVCRGNSGASIPPGIMQADLDDGSNIMPLHEITFLPPNGNFIILDRGTINPLVLNSTTADRNEINVSVSGNLTFTFDQNVAGPSVNNNTVIVRGEQTGIISGTLSGGGTSTITFDPTENFKAGEVIRVTLTTGIQSVEGGNLSGNQSYQFTTAAGPSPDTPPFFIERVLSSTANNAFGVFPADIDGDGDMDVAGSAADDNAVMWFENDGSQNFTEHTVSSTTSGPTGVYVEDINSDGHLDILVASQSGASILWFENDGSQNFTERSVTTNAGAPGKVYARDLDGDGDMDVVSTSFAPSAGSIANARLNYYINDGSETFTQFNISTVNGTSAYPIDVDSDGDIDLVATSEAAAATTLYDNELSWFENGGNLNFTEHIIDPVSRIQYDSYATDMDGDGDVDVLMVGSLSFVGWFENDGSENFTEHEIGSVESQPTAIYATDVDGDGDLDVITAHELLDEVVVWINDGAQNFTRQVVTNSANLVWDVYAADMDGDGDTDLLSASRLGDEISWYENTAAACSNPQPVTASAIVASTTATQPVTIDVISSATIGTGDVVTVTIESQPNAGNTTVNNDNTITYTPTVTGTFTIGFRITTQCGEFDTETVTVTVSDVPAEIVVYNGISPNGDTFNSYFRIENIETEEPENSVKIYNRWGDRVFEVSNYDNDNPDKRFKGVSDSGKDLPSGVYFYRIEFVSGRSSLEGYLTLKR